MPLFGAIEAGGTKFVCGIGCGPHDVETTRFPTTTPEETIARAAAFFRERATAPIEAVGIGSFGPLDLNPDSPTFGYITSTPKAAWRNFDLAGAVREALRAPVALDTDVNAAALGEWRWGAARGLSDSLYVTVGTGIGGGAIVNGRLLHGMLHPEMGHIRIPHDRTRDPFPGSCPYHGDCLEGLASGPAIEARWNAKACDLPPDHPAWALEARYLALALAAWVCTLSPQRILLGGGIMQQRRLFDPIRKEVAALLNGYIGAKELSEGLERYIQPPLLGSLAGIAGALALAEKATAL